jgi:hypothetical protein
VLYQYENSNDTLSNIVWDSNGQIYGSNLAGVVIVDSNGLIDYGRIKNGPTYDATGQNLGIAGAVLGAGGLLLGGLALFKPSGAPGQGLIDGLNDVAGTSGYSNPEYGSNPDPNLYFSWTKLADRPISQSNNDLGIAGSLYLASNVYSLTVPRGSTGTDFKNTLTTSNAPSFEIWDQAELALSCCNLAVYAACLLTQPTVYGLMECQNVLSSGNITACNAYLAGTTQTCNLAVTTESSFSGPIVAPFSTLTAYAGAFYSNVSTSNLQATGTTQLGATVLSGDLTAAFNTLHAQDLTISSNATVSSLQFPFVFEGESTPFYIGPDLGSLSNVLVTRTPTSNQSFAWGPGVVGTGCNGLLSNLYSTVLDTAGNFRTLGSVTCSTLSTSNATFATLTASNLTACNASIAQLTFPFVVSGVSTPYGVNKGSSGWQSNLLITTAPSQAQGFAWGPEIIPQSNGLLSNAFAALLDGYGDLTVASNLACARVSATALTAALINSSNVTTSNLNATTINCTSNIACGSLTVNGSNISSGGGGSTSYFTGGTTGSIMTTCNVNVSNAAVIAATFVGSNSTGPYFNVTGEFYYGARLYSFQDAGNNNGLWISADVTSNKPYSSSASYQNSSWNQISLNQIPQTTVNGKTNDYFELSLATEFAIKTNGNSWVAYSSENLKDEITLADDSLLEAAMLEMPLKRWKWKDEVFNHNASWGSVDRHQLGFVTSDVKRHFPHSVHPCRHRALPEVEAEAYEATQMQMLCYGVTRSLLKRVKALEDKVAAMTK